MKSFLLKTILITSCSLLFWFIDAAEKAVEQTNNSSESDALIAPEFLRLDSLRRAGATERNSPPHDVRAVADSEQQYRSERERNHSLKRQRCILLSACQRCQGEHDHERDDQGRTRDSLRNENKKLEEQNRILAEFCPMLGEVARGQFPNVTPDVATAWGLSGESTH